MKTINLDCYKIEVAMSFEAWIFLCATTNGTTNLMYFLSLLAKMKIKETHKKKRGIEYVVHAGEIDASLLSLAADWRLGRKAATRLLRDFARYGLISVAPDKLTSTIAMTCVACWVDGGRRTTNPCYTSKISNYEGVRIYLRSGQAIPTIRRNAKRSDNRKKEDKDDGDACEDTTHDPT